MRVYILLTLILLSSIIKAQNLEYDAQFYGFGDNREFEGYEYAASQTMLGGRTSFALGTTLDDRHSFRFGLDQLFEFGSELNEQWPELIAYYNFTDEHKTFYFGAFPRLKLIDFPLALITDTFNYYRPNIEGFYADYRWAWGHQGGFVDWTSRQTADRREAFMAALHGELNFGAVFFQHYLTLYHLASRGVKQPDEFVEDNFALVLYGGLNLDEYLPLSRAYIRAGLLESTYRNRGEGDVFNNAWSFTAEAYAEIKLFALKLNYNQGEGHHITNGDRFYDLDKYLRADIIWKFVQHKQVEGRFNLSFHWLNLSELNQSQQLSLIYRFGK